MNKKEITFYFSNTAEKNIFEPIAKTAREKKFKIKFTKNFKKPSNIGFYCFANNQTVRAKISIIFLGGVDQGRFDWPNIWEKQPWNKFDIAFLPGREWSHRWQSCSWFDKSRPKFGVFECGWPKIDIIKNKKLLLSKSNKIKYKYKINLKNKNILYAPSQECFEKQLDVALSIKNLRINLLVKHWVENRKIFKDKWEVVKKVNYKTKKLLGSQATIINPKENFINLLPIADLLITDESSVAYEALALNIPTLTVSDWKMQRHSKSAPRNIKPSKICYVAKKKNLRNKIIYILKNISNYKRKIKKKKMIIFQT